VFGTSNGGAKLN